MYVIILLLLIIIILNKMKKENMVNIKKTSYMGTMNLLSLFNGRVLISPNINTKQINTSEIVVRNKFNGIPSGIIIVWSGTLADVPDGWALCNGQNGTPDLRGKFILSYNDRVVKDGSGNTILSVRNIDDSGGEEKHNISIDEMPKHNHNIGRDLWDNNLPKKGGYDLGGNVGIGDVNSGIMTRTTYVGQGKKHNNMPPFYTLAYIIKL